MLAQLFSRPSGLRQLFTVTVRAEPKRVEALLAPLSGFQNIPTQINEVASKGLHTSPVLAKKKDRLISHKREQRYPYDPHQDWSFLRPPPRDDAPRPPIPDSLRNTPGYGSGGGGAPPFTFSKNMVKHNDFRRHSKFLMQEIEYEEAKKISEKRNIPAFRVGDVIELKYTVPENDMKVDTFVGLCFARRNRGMGSTFQLMNYIFGQVIERGFPLYSPHIVSMKILERRGSKKAQLYYYRKRKPSEWAVPFKPNRA
mmetsp:Transcript_18971/g.22707  ORF Transcript_18971/g.22707 Transcript_18971/m.22707 type:complete len:255 (+) Transcript_18971:279-1043(+)|eukprot:CAMPEP_0197863880 /NCGR_PEP_ID=MMETSP1438-20131217/41651_1 /TAXON_ID=1461541 /ORGANISM="Pterosperma sp., Strain CCMP1384" /LENGTH=254 /DNA_ID=CAMNT_0043481925 /DNA_START=272 /DNA_END=1036 /DNA_ORIENTATION=+